MELHIWMCGQKLMDQGRFVSAEVVEHDMDLALGRLCGHYLA